MSDHSQARDPLSENVVPFVPFGFLAKHLGRMGDGGKIERASRQLDSTTPTGSVPARDSDHFEKNAFSWHTSGRQRRLLLHFSESLARARSILESHRTKPVVSPLTKEFLELSLEHGRRRRFRRFALGVSFLFVAGAFLAGKLSTESGIDGTGQAKTWSAENAEVTNLSAPAAPTTSITRPAFSEPAPAQPAIETLPFVSQKPESLDGETGLPAGLAGRHHAAPEPPILSPIASEMDEFPETISPEPADPKSVSLLVEEIEANQRAGLRDEVFNHLRRLHETSFPTGGQPAVSPSSEEVRRLAIVIGKLSLIQGDYPAARLAWEQGYGDGQSASDPELSGADLRLLLARASFTAGRIEDAAVYLRSSDASPPAEPQPLVESILHWAFEERELALGDFRKLLESNPAYRDPAFILSYDWIPEVREHLEALRQSALD